VELDVVEIAMSYVGMLAAFRYARHTSSSVPNLFLKSSSRWTQPRASPPPSTTPRAGYSDYVQDTTHYHSRYAGAWKDRNAVVVDNDQGGFAAYM
jgi:hypothetical protein